MKNHSLHLAISILFFSVISPALSCIPRTIKLISQMIPKGAIKMHKCIAFIVSLLSIMPVQAMEQAAQSSSTAATSEAPSIEHENKLVEELLVEELINMPFADIEKRIEKLSPHEIERLQGYIFAKLDVVMPSSTGSQYDTTDPSILMIIAHNCKDILWQGLRTMSTSGNRRLMSSENEAQLKHSTTDLLIANLTGHSDRIFCVALHPNNRYALTGSKDQTARLWDLSQPTLPCRILQHSDRVTEVGFSPNGRYAFTCSFDKTVRLYDLSEQSMPYYTLNHTSEIFAGAFSPDGCYLATGTSDGTLSLWDVSQLTASCKELRGHTNAILCIAFSPNGKCLLTGSNDHTARLWDLTRNAVVHVFPHSNRVGLVAFSSTGRFVLTGSLVEMKTDLWDISQSPMSHLMQFDLPALLMFHCQDSYLLIIKNQKVHVHNLKHYRIKQHTLPEALLLLKLKSKPDCLIHDHDALKALKELWAKAIKKIPLITPEEIEAIDQEVRQKCGSDYSEELGARYKAAWQNATTINNKQTGNIIADFFYRSALPEPECYICSQLYDRDTRRCMVLPCCQNKKFICKSCLQELILMTYTTEYLEHQLTSPIKAKCPFCNTPADKIGDIKEFEVKEKSDTENAACAQTSE